MNENLLRLKALVAETNEVVANLNKETESIKESNQEERTKKYLEIRSYLMECVAIAKELNTTLFVEVDIPGFRYLDYPTEVFLSLNDRNERDYPIKFRTVYTRRGGDKATDMSRAFKNDSAIELPYYFSDHNSYNFIDNWNQELFEKRFAAEVERSITEKANKANEKYQSAINSQKLLER